MKTNQKQKICNIPRIPWLIYLLLKQKNLCTSFSGLFLAYIEIILQPFSGDHFPEFPNAGLHASRHLCGKKICSFCIQKIFVIFESLVVKNILSKSVISPSSVFSHLSSSFPLNYLQNILLILSKKNLTPDFCLLISTLCIQNVSGVLLSPSGILYTCTTCQNRLNFSQLFQHFLRFSRLFSIFQISYQFLSKTTPIIPKNSQPDPQNQTKRTFPKIIRNIFTTPARSFFNERSESTF